MTLGLDYSQIKPEKVFIQTSKPSKKLIFSLSESVVQGCIPVDPMLDTSTPNTEG